MNIGNRMFSGDFTGGTEGRDTFFQDAQARIDANNLEKLKALKGAQPIVPERARVNPYGEGDLSMEDYAKGMLEMKRQEAVAGLGEGAGFGVDIEKPKAGMFDDMTKDDEALLAGGLLGLGARANNQSLLEADAIFRAHGKSGKLLESARAGLAGSDVFADFKDAKAQNAERDAVLKRKDDLLSSLSNSNKERYSPDDIAAATQGLIRR